MAEERKITHKDRLLYGVIFIFFGVIFLLAGYEDETRSESNAYKVLGIIFLLLVPIYYYVIFRYKRRGIEARNRQILYAFLEKNNYQTTIIEFAVKSGLDTEEARRIIETMAVKSGVNPIVDENGILHYKFK